jgi:predicted nucleotide-binding protein
VPETTIFIGSSAAAKSQAKAFVKAFTGPTLKFLPWWEAFTPGRTLLEDLDSIRERVDGAILLFSPEATTRIRRKRYYVPNLNVLFEFGYFYGHFGKQRVAMLKYGDFYLPSDFGGYIHIFGSSFFKRAAVVQVGKRTTTEFTRWVGQL